jgi:hypothetical protein
MDFSLVCSVASMVFAVNAMVSMSVNARMSIIFLAMGTLLAAMAVTAGRNEVRDH